MRHRRQECSACGYDGLEVFLDLGYTPIADAYTERPDQIQPTYALQLAVCTGCWLVQLMEVVDHEVLFGTGYSFYSSASAPLSTYHAAYASDIASTNFELAKRLTVEIGCNDGDMLRHFHDAGCQVLGVDPALGPLQVAAERGIPALHEAFSRTTAEYIRDTRGPAGIIIANHVLAHVESVADVLDGIQHLLAEDGYAYVEVQYLPDLLVNNAFDLVYHEHRNFFSMTSLERAVERWGLRVVHSELTDRQGGSLRVVLARSRQYSQEFCVCSQEGWLRSIEAYRGFQGRVDRIRDRLVDIVNHSLSPIIGYGAPAKATTLLNFCGIDRFTVDRVIDTTAAKQGRHIPGVGIPIVAPGSVNLNEAGTVLLLAWNYANSIMRRHRDFEGAWVVPIPAPVRL